MVKLASKLSLILSEKAILSFIKSNPGARLYQINQATLNSHHSWGTKSILTELERKGKVYVQRQQHGNKVSPRYFVTL